MNPEELSKFSFDEVVISIMALAGIATPIIGLVTLAFVLQSWFGAARTSVRLAKAGRNLAAEASRAEPVRGAVSVIVAILVPTAQLLTLGMCYVGGNYISIQFDDARQLQVQALFDQRQHLEFDSRQPFKFLNVGWVIGTARVIRQALQLDYISAGYVLFAAILIGVSYKYARDGRNRYGMYTIGMLLALPATIYLVIGGVAEILALILILLTFLMGGSASLGSEIIQQLPWLYALLFAGIYFLACHAAVRGSILVVRSWAKPAEP